MIEKISNVPYINTDTKRELAKRKKQQNKQDNKRKKTFDETLEEAKNSENKMDYEI